VNTYNLTEFKRFLLEEDLAEDEIEEINFQRGQASNTSTDELSRKILRRDRYDDIDYTEYNQSPLNHKKFMQAFKDGNAYYKEYGDKAIIIYPPNSDVPNYNLLLVDLNANTMNSFFWGTIQFKGEDWSGEAVIYKKKISIKYFNVVWSDLTTSARGSGYGKLMYKELYEFAKENDYALASDSILYESSAGMWTRYISTIAKAFGVIIDDKMIVPLSKKELEGKYKDILGNFIIDRFIATDSPPQLMQYMIDTFTNDNISYIEGEILIVDASYYGIDEPISYEKPPKKNKSGDDIEDATPSGRKFADYVDKDISLAQLLTDLSNPKLTDPIFIREIKDSIRRHKTKKIDGIRAAVFCFSDATVCLKDVGGKIKWINF